MMGPQARVFANGGLIGSGRAANVQDILGNAGMGGGGGGGGLGGFGGIRDGGIMGAGQRPAAPSTFRPGPPPGASGGAGGGIAGLLEAQRSENNRARQSNEANWQHGRGMLLGAQQNFNRDPMLAQARGLAGNLMANPEAINDRVQGMIQNKAANTIDAQTNNMAQQQAGMLAAGGQTDAASLAAMQERLGRNAMAQRTNIQSGLEVQRANQRNQDIMNATQLGQGVLNQQHGFNMNAANSFLANMPQYRPDDLSGYIAAMGQQGGGPQQGPGGQMQQPQQQGPVQFGGMGGGSMFGAGNRGAGGGGMGQASQPWHGLGNYGPAFGQNQYQQPQQPQGNGMGQQQRPWNPGGGYSPSQGGQFRPTAQTPPPGQPGSMLAGPPAPRRPGAPEGILGMDFSLGGMASRAGEARAGMRPEGMLNAQERKAQGMGGAVAGVRY